MEKEFVGLNYFSSLYMVDPPSGQLQDTELKRGGTNPPLDDTTHPLLKSNKRWQGCEVEMNLVIVTSVQLVKAGGPAMIRRLHVALTAVWQSGTISIDWKRAIPISKEKGGRQDWNNYRVVTLHSVPGKALARFLFMWIRGHLLKKQRSRESMSQISRMVSQQITLTWRFMYECHVGSSLSKVF